MACSRPEETGVIWGVNGMNIVSTIPTIFPNCETCEIGSHALCRSVRPELRAELERMARVRRYPRGKTIMGQDEDAVVVGSVISGVVKMSYLTSAGDYRIVGLRQRNDFFGRAFSETSRFSLEAATDVTACVIPRKAFDDLLLRFPQMEHALLVATLEELDIVREWMALTNGRTSIQRLATFLMLLKPAAPEPHGHGTVTEIPLSRRDVAATLNMAHETLSRTLHQLAREKVIRLIDVRHFELLDPKALREHADGGATDLLPEAPAIAS